MKATSLILLIVNVVLLNAGIALCVDPHSREDGPPAIAPPISNAPVEPVVPERLNYHLSGPKPVYLDLHGTQAKLAEWATEAPGLAEVGTYGKSRRGQELGYIRVGNRASEKPRPVVLITACIHGNEPLSASTTMWFIGTLLDQYGDQPEITELLDTRDIYFVPIVSPDSYPGSRHVDGVDPNRDFPSPMRPGHVSVPPVKALQDFSLRIKPSAVISGHTWGRVFLTPWGDSMQNCPNHDDYARIVGQMCEKSGYRMMRACDMYGPGGGLAIPGPRQYGMVPIHGTDVDWFHRQGAFAVIIEFGTHQRIPSPQDIQIEFDKTFAAVCHFIREAPAVEVRQTAFYRRAG